MGNIFIRKITLADRVKIVKQYQEGKGISDLAKEYKITRSSIRYHLKKANVIKAVSVSFPASVHKYNYAEYLSIDQKREKRKLECNHPSLKCGVCGKFIDNLK